jgi:glycosyltransferase involved in cell wall biosynthesis
LGSANFALYVAGDAYSTERKIMGRQSAGKAMVRGIARHWPDADLHAFGYDRRAGEALARQLASYGHTGTVRWREGPGDPVMDRLGAVYYPAPVSSEVAHARNARGPASYSLFGVTHTLSSAGAMDQVSALVMPPFKPWDALICTSSAAHTVVSRLQDEMREWLSRETGATRFNPIQLPVIPLGVDAPAFARTPGGIASARSDLGLADDEVAFLFAGRLSFHAKANPSALYQALEAAAGRVSQRLVCIEAGLFPNVGMARAFAQARAQLAPSVRFIEVDGANESRYRSAWQASDVFVSLSDNIQETFGLTPLEAMAGGQPVLVSDWNGYKDTVRDGVDGYKIPVTLPPGGCGKDLATRHAVGRDTYDFFIGRVSMQTVVDVDTLTDRIVSLASDRDMRLAMGAAGAERARTLFDWPVILDRYVDLAANLTTLRRAAVSQAAEPWPIRPDPFVLFGDYPTRSMDDAWTVTATVGDDALAALLDLEIARYILDPEMLTAEAIGAVHARIVAGGGARVGDLRQIGDVPARQVISALMWLAKFNAVRLHP